MKPNRVVRIALFTLAVLLCAVWLGNLSPQTFQPVVIIPADSEHGMPSRALTLAMCQEKVGSLDTDSMRYSDTSTSTDLMKAWEASLPTPHLYMIMFDTSGSVQWFGRLSSNQLRGNQGCLFVAEQVGIAVYDQPFVALWNGYAVLGWARIPVDGSVVAGSYSMGRNSEQCRSDMERMGIVKEFITDDILTGKPTGALSVSVAEDGYLVFTGQVGQIVYGTYDPLVITSMYGLGIATGKRSITENYPMCVLYATRAGDHGFDIPKVAYWDGEKLYPSVEVYVDPGQKTGPKPTPYILHDGKTVHY